MFANRMTVVCTGILVVIVIACALAPWLAPYPYQEIDLKLGATPPAPAMFFRHLLPNVLSSVIVYGTLTVPTVILQEAFLSFLGLGVQPPRASWGTLISDGAGVMGLFPWLVFFPSVLLAAVLFSFN